jgi:predicted Fe-Mo cluster-binding NifX family protein
VKLAIAQWKGRISPVFDSAGEVLVLETVAGWRVHREVVHIAGKGPLERARSLHGLGAQILICGAISRPMKAALAGAGIEVIPNTCGVVEDVLNAFLNGRLNDKAFQMPGPRRWKFNGSADRNPRM